LRGTKQSLRWQVSIQINVGLLIAAGAYYFLLDEKVTKNQDSKNASLPHRPCPQTVQNPGAALCCPSFAPSLPCFSNKLMPLSHKAITVPPGFCRSCFPVGEERK